MCIQQLPDCSLSFSLAIRAHEVAGFDGHSPKLHCSACRNYCPSEENEYHCQFLFQLSATFTSAQWGRQNFQDQKKTLVAWKSERKKIMVMYVHHHPLRGMAAFYPPPPPGLFYATVCLDWGPNLTRQAHIQHLYHRSLKLQRIRMHCISQKTAHGADHRRCMAESAIHRFGRKLHCLENHPLYDGKKLCTPYTVFPLIIKGNNCAWAM